MVTPKWTLEQLLALRTLASLSTGEAFMAVGLLVDFSAAVGNEEGAPLARKLAEELGRRQISPREEALLHYFVANSWADSQRLRIVREGASWSWDQPETYQMVLALRRALTSTGFPALEKERRSQIHTNLANALSNIGRFVEAIEHYDRALAEIPNFGMALCNRGMCLHHYARSLYDYGHVVLFASRAAELLERGLREPLEPGSIEGFRRYEESSRRIAADCHRPDVAYLSEHDLGRSKERRFRRWALRERLFANPLNDLGPFAIAARDVLHMPAMTVALEIGSGFHGFFNQLKQELAAARLSLYYGLEHPARHFADREVGLRDTRDGTVFGLAVERVKAALRSAYSILDKVAVFIARYFDLALPIKRVSFRAVWFSEGNAKKGIEPAFANRANWPLRGLFWLARDLSEEGGEFDDAMEPDAREMVTLRNHLEHQYVKVEGAPDDIEMPYADVPPDPFAYRIDRAALEAKALRMVRRARAALVYLSLAVHSNEKAKPPSTARAIHGDLDVIE